MKPKKTNQTESCLIDLYFDQRVRISKEFSQELSGENVLIVLRKFIS